MLLATDETTPNAQVMIYTVIGHFLATGQRLLENMYVRTSSSNSTNWYIYIGSFNPEGLVIMDHADEFQSTPGVVSEKKPL